LSAHCMESRPLDNKCRKYTTGGIWHSFRLSNRWCTLGGRCGFRYRK